MSPQPTSVPAASSPAEDDPFAIKKRLEKRFLSSHPVIATLDVEYNELSQYWTVFQRHLQPADQVERHERLQNSSDVANLVGSIQATWIASERESLFSRSMSRLKRLISTLDYHSPLLVRLPKHELYLSLLYGVFQSIIKASADYPRVMEGMTKILVKINKSAKEALRNQDVTWSIVYFYSLTFFTLSEMMRWYVGMSKCRLLKSPNQDVYLYFKTLVTYIQSSVRLIVRDAMDIDDYGSEAQRRADFDLAFWEETRLSQIGLQKPERKFAAELAIVSQQIWEIQQHLADNLTMTAGTKVLLKLMRDSASGLLRLEGPSNGGIACLTTAATQDIDSSRFSWSKGSKHKCTRVGLQIASAHLQDFFDSDDQVAGLGLTIPVAADASLVEPLNHWASTVHSQVLAVCSSPSMELSSPVAGISACFAVSAREAQIPVISHFCSLPTDPRDGMTLFEQGLIALTYSLIRQLIDFLPPVLESHAACDLESERFVPLNGKLTSWKEVLSLVDVLLFYSPPLMVCVIDGLDVIQDASTDQRLRSLVRTILSHTRHEKVAGPGGHRQRVILKVLFTVEGRPESLVKTLAENPLTVSQTAPVETPATDQVMNSGMVMMNA
ncbi:uncharacterized protein BDW47DRAFT_103036 [Aspergillus candidus]|uniref:Uncharacterized protein n=1 Tax=Aspergillus candidus TaxID=41067 RepID=A0A2I2FFL9_ASPCN|nr:hypothetical protein BDW47DRAFT_103036 [Aspergillus candidus]PLB39426.1 hypothetical protein BDW47DRAFT_103036 [Aspergillus candidus]